MPQYSFLSLLLITFLTQMVQEEFQKSNREMAICQTSQLVRKYGSAMGKSV